MPFKYVITILVIGVVDFFVTIFLYEQLGTGSAFIIYCVILFIGWLFWLRLKKRFKVSLSLFEQEMKKLQKSDGDIHHAPATKFFLLVSVALVFLIVPGVVTSVLGVSLLAIQLFASDF